MSRNFLANTLCMILLLLVSSKMEGKTWAVEEAAARFRDFESYRNTGDYQQAWIALAKLLPSFIHQPLSDSTFSLDNAKLVHMFLLTVGLPEKANELNENMTNYSEEKYGSQSKETQECKYWLRPLALIDQGKYKSAKRLLETLSNITSTTDPLFKQTLLFQIARCETGLQDFDNAFEHLQEATSMASNVRQNARLQQAFLNIELANQKGVIKRELGEHQTADEHFQNALSIHRKFFPEKFLYLKSRVYRNSGLNNERRGLLDNSILDFEKSDNIYKGSFGASHDFVIEINFFLRRSHLARGIEHEAAGDIRNALLHFQKCIDYDDNLLQLKEIRNDSNLFLQPEFK